MRVRAFRRDYEAGALAEMDEYWDLCAVERKLDRLLSKRQHKWAPQAGPGASSSHTDEHVS